MLQAFGKSDKGRVRESNQDGFLISHLSDDTLLVVLCDGMGGANGGNVASSVAINVVANRIVENFKRDMSENSIKNMIESAVFAANVELFDISMNDDELRGMGTTIIVGIFVGRTLHMTHVGDSRAYIASVADLKQITRDHSVVQVMVEKGQITEEEARSHPRKHFITRAVGVDNQVDCEYNQLVINANESVLFCSDGLSNLLESQEILKIIQETKDYDTVVDILVHKANMAGGSDNITAVYIV